MKRTLPLLLTLALLAVSVASAQDNPTQKDKLPAEKNTKVRDTYTPISVVTELTVDIARWLPSEVYDEIREWEKKVQADGKEAAMRIPLRLHNSMTIEAVRNKLGKEDRITEDQLPGVVYVGSADGPRKEVKGKYLWYGRVGFGFIDTDRDPKINAVLALRFTPKKPDPGGEKP